MKYRIAYKANGVQLYANVSNCNTDNDARRKFRKACKSRGIRGVMIDNVVPVPEQHDDNLEFLKNIFGF